MYCQTYSNVQIFSVFLISNQTVNFPYSSFNLLVSKNSNNYVVFFISLKMQIYLMSFEQEFVLEGPRIKGELMFQSLCDDYCATGLGYWLFLSYFRTLLKRGLCFEATGVVPKLAQALNQTNINNFLSRTNTWNALLSGP